MNNKLISRKIFKMFIAEALKLFVGLVFTGILIYTIAFSINYFNFNAIRVVCIINYVFLAVRWNRSMNRKLIILLSEEKDAILKKDNDKGE